MNQKVFEEYAVPKAVYTMALPTVLSMLVTIFYNMADTFFVGQTGDPNQVAAVSLTMPVFMVFMAIGNIFGIGGGSLISRLLGERRYDEVKHASSFAFYGCVAMGLIFTVISLVGMPQILGMIGCSEHTEKFAYDYLIYIAYGCVFVVVSNAMGNIVRAEGSSKTAMIGMMIGTVTNIVLDPVMILWMNMGVAGAAIATIIGNIFATAFYLYYLLRHKTALSISPQDFCFHREIVSGIFAIGVPAAINNLLMSVANIVFNNYLAKYGDNAIAAMGVALKANMLVVLLQIGVAMGITPLLGYNYGAGNYRRLRSVIRFAILCNVVMGVVLTLLYLLFTQQIIAAFLNDAQVIDFGVVMLRALMISGPFLGILFVFNATFQAMGKATPALILSLSRQGVIFVPVLIIADSLVGLNGIIYAQPAADIAAILLSTVMFLFLNRGLHRSQNQNTPLEQAAPEKVSVLEQQDI